MKLIQSLGHQGEKEKLQLFPTSFPSLGPSLLKEREKKAVSTDELLMITRRKRGAAESWIS